MNEEIWKDVQGYDGLYRVSNLGRVKSVSRTVKSRGNSVTVLAERILKPGKRRDGYLYVILFRNSVAKYYLVHRLVAETFIPNNNLFTTTVNHKNEVKTDNRVENLEWLSNEDNIRYSNAGSKNYKAKPVRCVETGQVFGSTTEASRWLGLSKKTLGTSIWRGSRSGGYHWEYV